MRGEIDIESLAFLDGFVYQHEYLSRHRKARTWALPLCPGGFGPKQGKLAQVFFPARRN
jgi:hypothetical protein